jgi:hypothetical protein
MTWDQHSRRRAALDAVLDFAAAHPEADLPFAQLPGLYAIFGDRRGLLVALQARWSQALWARIEMLSVDSRRDAAVLSVQAWRECAALNPVLRRLLDRHLADCGDAALERHEELAAG